MVSDSLVTEADQSSSLRKYTPPYDPLSLKLKAQLPLILTLFRFFKEQSFIDKRSCLNPRCEMLFAQKVKNYASEAKLELLKQDSHEAVTCKHCEIQRHCALYRCRHCLVDFCYYCLINASKLQLLGTLHPKPPAAAHLSQQEQILDELSLHQSKIDVAVP